MIKLLGLPLWSVGSGYRYITRSDVPFGLSLEDLRRTN